MTKMSDTPAAQTNGSRKQAHGSPVSVSDTNTGLLLVWFLLVTSVAIGVAVELILLHVEVHTHPSVTSFCSITKHVSCLNVAESRYAVFLGVPNAVWAVGGLLVFLIFGFRALFSERNRGLGILAVGSYLAVLASAILAFTSVFLIRSFCILCTTLAGLNIFLAILASLAIRRSGKSFGALFLSDLTFLFKRPAGIAMVGLAVITTVGLMVYYPAYWNGPVHAGPGNLDHGFDAQGHPWIGAKHPLLTIDEYTDFDCPFCRIAHAMIRKVIQLKPTTIRLVHYDFPLDQACNPEVDRPYHMRSCELARAARCAGKQGKYWYMADMIFARLPRNGGPNLDALVRKLHLDPDRFSRCMKSAPIRKVVSDDVSDANHRDIQGTPTFYLNGQQMHGFPTAGKILRRLAKEEKLHPRSATDAGASSAVSNQAARPSLVRLGLSLKNCVESVNPHCASVLVDPIASLRMEAMRRLARATGVWTANEPGWPNRPAEPIGHAVQAVRATLDKLPHLTTDRMDLQERVAMALILKHAGPPKGCQPTWTKALPMAKLFRWTSWPKEAKALARMLTEPYDQVSTLIMPCNGWTWRTTAFHQHENDQWVLAELTPDTIGEHWWRYETLPSPSPFDAPKASAAKPARPARHGPGASALRAPRTNKVPLRPATCRTAEALTKWLLERLAAGDTDAVAARTDSRTFTILSTASSLRTAPAQKTPTKPGETPTIANWTQRLDDALHHWAQIRPRAEVALWRHLLALTKSRSTPWTACRIKVVGVNELAQTTGDYREAGGILAETARALPLQLRGLVTAAIVCPGGRQVYLTVTRNRTGPTCWHLARIALLEAP